jgi:hypothetical protein
MDIRTYQQIYEELNSPEHIHEISQEFSLFSSTVSNIFHQKIVRNVRKNHGRMVRKAPALVRSWKKGATIMDIADKHDFPPVLTASIILKEMGLRSKSIIKNPDLLQNKRMKNELNQAIDTDFCFSPKAHVMQSNHGKLGEELIHIWLEGDDLDFLTESDLNKEPNTKTPDFLLHEPMRINGNKVRWIESKAVFADETEHNRYQKKQFQFYEDLYGPGMVVYWYGFLDTITPGNYLITDYTFFENISSDLDRLLNHSVKW